MQDSSDRSSSDEIMVQVCIHIVSEGNKLSQKSRHVMRENFFHHVTIDSVGPVKLLVWQSGEIRFLSTEPESCMLHLDKI